MKKETGELNSSAEWDPQGLAIKDYFEGDHQAELIVTSDCAGTEVVPASVFFKDYGDLSDLEQYALSICQGKVLDIGAGAGTHSLILQEQGLDVTPLDISAIAVEVMRRQGLKAAVCDDIWSYTAGPFDTVLMMMNGIGLVGELRRLEEFLRKVRPLVKEDGQLLLDSTDLSYFEEFYQYWGPRQMLRGRYFGEIEFRLSYRDLSGPPFKWLFLDQQTLQETAAMAGWFGQIIFEEEGHYLARLIRD